MDALISKYLNTVEKQLKPMSASERSDIVHIIESHIEETCFFQGKSSQEVIDSLGDPTDLAHSYLGDSISRTRGVSLNKLLMMISFYRTAGHSSLFVLPCLSVLSIGLIASGITIALVGLFQAASFLLGQSTLYAAVQFGILELSPFMIFPVALFTGILLALGGVGAWQLMMHYVKTVGVDKQKFGWIQQA